MLAFAWRWQDAGHSSSTDLSKRLASSLCAGIGGHASHVQMGQIHWAFRPLRSDLKTRSWKPSVLPDGRIVAFHGYFDNADAIAKQLGADPDDLTGLYGFAVQRWGDEANRRIIGEYVAIIADPARGSVQLARSPLRGPPLHYFHDDNLIAAASVPRALFAAGVEQRLNERRLGDSALINFTNREESWFEGVSRVPTDCVIQLEPGRPRVLRKYYDLLSMPNVRLKSDAEYLARASELLDEGVRSCMAGFKRPGSTLSAGLDTPQVAVRALAALPAGEKLPTFTFHPEPGYDGREEPNALGNERPFVEAFAAMHPGLEPHFTANEGYGHDHRWRDFFHLMGGAPSGLTNMYVFHGLLTEAAKAKCDVLLLAEWGNFSFSDQGAWGFVEYLLRGNLRQLWLALTRLQRDDRSIAWRFLIRTASAFLPGPLWRLAKRRYWRGGPPLLELMQPLSKAYRASSGADARLKASGLEIERYQPWSRRHAQRLLFMTDDAEGAEIYQAFEQMYGVAMRDPTAYRPFVEFCFGLPVKMFMRDGQTRWLAKEMAKGNMPEEQRVNARNGRWDADWHLRMGRKRKEYLAEIDEISKDSRISEMLDLPRLRSVLEDWPSETPVDPQDYFTREFAVPRGLMTARFVKYVERSND